MSAHHTPEVRLDSMGRVRRLRPLSERFAAKWVPNHDTGCHEWTGARMPSGHGQIALRGRRPVILAHRAAWLLAHGSIPPGMCVCHRCDNPRCVNVAHLFLGTQADNMADCRAKGRATLPPRMRGANHPRVKLTEDGVREIRVRLARGDRLTDIATDYGVVPTTIAWIRDGEHWRSVQ